jgi:transcriptional regulator with XRE-family HTH domain
MVICSHGFGSTNSKKCDMMQGSLAERLRVLRAQRGLSLTEASEMIGVNRHTLRDLELGKREPYGPTLRKITEGYDVPLARLLEEPVAAVKAEAPEAGPASLEEEQLETNAPRDPQQWERALASVRERQSAVEAKVGELIELADHSEVNPYQVKWALDEAQDCADALLLALPGSHKKGRQITFDDLWAVNPDQWEEWLAATRFYESILERLVVAGLVVLRERAGQKPEPVAVGIGA